MISSPTWSATRMQEGASRCPRVTCLCPTTCSRALSTRSRRHSHTPRADATGRSLHCPPVTLAADTAVADTAESPATVTTTEADIRATVASPRSTRLQDLLAGPAATTTRVVERQRTRRRTHGYRDVPTHCEFAPTVAATCPATKELPADDHRVGGRYRTVHCRRVWRCGIARTLDRAAHGARTQGEKADQDDTRSVELK